MEHSVGNNIVLLPRKFQSSIFDSKKDITEKPCVRIPWSNRVKSAREMG